VPELARRVRGVLRRDCFRSSGTSIGGVGVAWLYISAHINGPGWKEASGAPYDNDAADAKARSETDRSARLMATRSWRSLRMWTRWAARSSGTAHLL
jgi:hypothetical protein